jgi:hypothetical protein
MPVTLMKFIHACNQVSAILAVLDVGMTNIYNFKMGMTFILILVLLEMQ